jgi:hypothetical protein
MARDATFDLGAALSRPGFTPAARDAPALVELIADGAEPAATRAAPALAGLRDIGRTAIEARLAGPREDGDDSHGREAREGRARGEGREGRARGEGRAGRVKRGAEAGARAALDDGAKARLVGVLGLLARAGDDHARAAVVAQVSDAAPRVRRAAIVALGKVGGDDALARLRALDAVDDAELMRRRDRAVLMADRSAKRDEESLIALDAAPPAPIAIQLGCRAGLGALLLEEITALGLAAPSIAARGERGAELRLAAPLASLFASRLWATIAVPIRLARASDLAAAITQTILAPSTLALLRAWTRGPIRWRLGFAHGHKRAIVWRVARDVTAAAPGLINDPTATTWDVLVDDEAGSLALVPRRLDDPRFAYRVAEVPAASHPTVAAALAWVAEARPEDRVWDPFCGSGLEIVERARRGPARSLLGTDIDPAALDAARRNIGAAGVQAELAVADARSHAPGVIDLIVTNPPLGSRVQIDAAGLLVAALPSLARSLAPRGRLVWITPSARRTTPVAEQLGLVRVRGLAVDLGGVRGHLERWDRR